MKLINLVALLVAIQFSDSHAQENSNSTRVSAYQDFRNYLYAFIDGVPRQLETQPVRAFATGGNMVAYVDNANDLIVWQNNEKFDLGDATATKYELTNTLLYYQRDMLLAAWENGQLTRLTHFLRDFKVNDQLIAFRDQTIDMLKVYYKGKVTDVEYTLTGGLGAYKAGKNSVAYTNNLNFFKVYVDDHLYEIDNFPPIEFETGRNITAFIAGTTRLFEVFFNGKLVVLENIPPRNFKCGDELTAYVADEGNFKVFDNGKLIKIESFPPDFYEVLDGSVLFFTNNQFQLIQNGERYVLDNFMPSSYQMNSNCIAWQDPQGRLYMFSNGEKQVVTREIVTEYNVNAEILRFRLADNSYKIYYRGKTY